MFFIPYKEITRKIREGQAIFQRMSGKFSIYTVEHKGWFYDTTYDEERGWIIKIEKVKNK